MAPLHRRAHHLQDHISHHKPGITEGVLASVVLSDSRTTCLKSLHTPIPEPLDIFESSRLAHTLLDYLSKTRGDHMENLIPMIPINAPAAVQVEAGQRALCFNRGTSKPLLSTKNISLNSNLLQRLCLLFDLGRLFVCCSLGRLLDFRPLPTQIRDSHVACRYLLLKAALLVIQVSKSAFRCCSRFSA